MPNRLELPEELASLIEKREQEDRRQKDRRTEATATDSTLEKDQRSASDRRDASQDRRSDNSP